MDVNIINNILPIAVFNKIKTHNNNILNEQILRKSSSTWEKNIVEYSSDVLVYRLNERSIEYSLIKKEIEKYNNSRIVSMSYHYWKPGSYIPWHNDGKYSSAITIYLNDTWNYEWGGLFQYHDGKNVISITPQKNMGVYQEKTLPHSTTIIRKESPVRKSIQVFFSDEKIKSNDTTII